MEKYGKILKKYLFMMVILIIFAAQSRVAYAGDGDFIITEEGILSKYIGNDTSVSVPDKVTVIGDGAFANCTQLEELILPEGVIEIRDNAFSGCENLKHITLPDTLTTIQIYAFNNCNSLKEVTIPKSVTRWSISQNDEDYEDGIERYEVDPENVKFSSLDGIVYNKAMTVLLYYPYNRKESTYTLPDSVTDISKADFSGAKNLEHIIFNTKVTMEFDPYGLNSRHFLNSTLERFTVPTDNKTFCDIDGVLFSKDKKILIAYPNERAGETYLIPVGTERLYYYSLSTGNTNNFNLKYVLFPESVKTIDNCTGYYIGSDDAVPYKDLVFFGKKGSVAETYAKANRMQFANYNPTQKETLLLTASELSLVPAATIQIESLLVSSDKTQSISWKSSNSSVVTVNQKGKLSAKKIGSAVISVTTKSGLKATCKITVKLPAPSDISIVKGSSSGVDLTWKKVAGATSYTIYRLANYGYTVNNPDIPYSKLATTTKLSYTDKNVKEATEYNYSIIANHAKPSYRSEYSDPCYLYVPYNVKAVKVTQEKDGALLSWNTDDYSFGIIIYRATSKNGKYNKLYDQISDNASFMDTSVKTGSTYYYKIRSYNAYDDVKIYTGYTNPVSIKIK